MKLKISQKLIGLFIIMGLTPFLLISIYAFINSRNALEKNARDRLSFLLESRKETIALYLDTVKSQVTTQAQSTMIRDAMRRFATSFKQFTQEEFIHFSSDQETMTTRLKTRYIYQESHTLDAPKDARSLWFPKEWYVQYLQYLYIADNPFPINEKCEMVKAKDNSLYSVVHSEYHPIFHHFTEEFGYHDLFLVEAKTGHIVYSVSKEVDYGTSLLTGPYADTHVAKIFKAAAAAEKPAIFFSDFAMYPVFFNREAAFIAAPIFENKSVIGIIIFQIPVDRINHIMTSGHQWQSVGLGKSGESVLVGPDLKFRSNSRHLFEKPEVLKQQLSDMGVEPQVIDRARQLNTAIGTLSYDIPIVSEALQGKSGVKLTLDYRGVSVLAGYAPLDTLGTRWAIITAIDEDEIFKAFFSLRQAMIFLGVIGIVAVLAVGGYLARSISRPLNEVIGVLSSSSAQITTSITEQESVARQQASAVQETNATMEELGTSSKLSSEQAQAAAAGSQQVLDLSEEGREKMEDMVLGMDTLKEKVDDIAKQILHLSEQTGKIGDITNLVSDFANETKMLAMNAAVEAVRAGEHGKGFSVLSVEIRKLADESKRSAERINALVAEIQKVTNATVMATEEGTKNVNRGAELARATSETFQNVSTAIGEAARNTTQIALNVQQQAIAVKQVVEAMGTLNQGAKETSSGIGQVKAGIQTLNDAARTLKEMV